MQPRRASERGCEWATLGECHPDGHSTGLHPQIPSKHRVLSDSELGAGQLCDITQWADPIATVTRVRAGSVDVLGVVAVIGGRMERVDAGAAAWARVTPQLRPTRTESS